MPKPTHFAVLLYLCTPNHGTRNIALLRYQLGICEIQRPQINAVTTSLLLCPAALPADPSLTGFGGENDAAKVQCFSHLSKYFFSGNAQEPDSENAKKSDIAGQRGAPTSPTAATTTSPTSTARRISKIEPPTSGAGTATRQPRLSLYGYTLTSMPRRYYNQKQKCARTRCEGDRIKK